MSASRMIDDIIKSFLALPDMQLTSEVSAEFKKITNRLILTGQKITLDNFKTAWALIPQSCITLNEMNEIEKYLKAWELMIIELDKFMLLMGTGWKAAHDSIIGGDDALSFIVSLIPRDEETFSQLRTRLLYAADVAQNGESGYYINAFANAAEFHYNKEYDPEDTEYVKYNILIRDLRLENALALLMIAANLIKICQQKMEEYCRDIYNGFELRFINEAGEKVEKIDKPENLEAATPNIILMHAKVGEHPFTSYPELGKDVKKFIAYYELLKSLQRSKNNNVFERLRECSYKFPIHEASLDTDLDTIKVPFGETIQTYLGIPDDKRTSIFNYLWAPPKPELPLRKFMEYLARKISQIEVEYEEKKHAAANSTSPAVNL